MDDPGTLTHGPESENVRRRAARSAAVLFVVLHTDVGALRPSRHVLTGIEAVTLGRGDGPRAVRIVGSGNDALALSIPDRHMSGRHAVLTRTTDGRLRVVDARSKNGVFVNGVRTLDGVLADRDVLELGRTFLIVRDPLTLEDGDPDDLEAPPLGGALDHLVTLSPALAHLFAAVVAVAPSPLAVFIGGETGTGKEGLARALHTASRRRGPFVAVNCGALTATLVQSELFGYKKGAFSGATEDRPGLVCAADGGTLFLDEIGDLPPPAQAALLRVLQEREVRPVGGVRSVPVDFRLVSATHRDLEAAVRDGVFRADLYGRICGYAVHLPPLRRRREDLGLLIAAILARHAQPGAGRVELSRRAALRLLRHPFPRNIRELDHRLAAALLVARGGVLDEADLFGADDGGGEDDEADDVTAAPAETPLDPADVLRRDALVALLEAHEGNVSAVARAMGKARMQVQRLMKRYGLSARRYRK